MNILLTDLNSLTLDLPEIPVLPPEAGDSFTRLLQQELSPEFENSGQVTEFTNFFMGLSVTQDVPAGAPKAAIEAWQDYLSRQQIRVTTNAEATPLMPLQSAAEPAPETRIPLQHGDADALAAGARLPNSGNPLPPAASLAADIMQQPAESVLPRVENTVALAGAVGGSVAAKLSAAAVAPSAMHAAAPVAEIRGLTPVTAPPADIDRIATTNPAQPLPARVASMQQTSAGEFETAAAVIERAAPLQTRGGEVPLRATASETIAAPTTTVAESAAAASRPPAPVSMNNAAALVVDPELRLAGQSIANADIQAIESNHARLPPAPRGAVAVDAARFGESHEIPNFVQQSVKPAAELAAGGNEPFVRAAEVTVGAGGSQSQPAPVVPAAVVNSGSPAAATPAPLPVHLESMTIARNAEPAAWGEGLGERVSWMVNQKQNSAIIRLDPPLLGKLDVQVRLADDATTITIQTQHAQTRDLIETASARLRDYLQESGFQNVNVDVSQRQDQQQADAQGAPSEQAGEQQETLAEQEAEGGQGQHAVYSIGEGLLDTFA